LDVVAYTFRPENTFLPLELRSSANPVDYGNAIAEFKQFFARAFTERPHGLHESVVGSWPDRRPSKEPDAAFSRCRRVP
jgi:hypothetical protein